MSDFTKNSLEKLSKEELINLLLLRQNDDEASSYHKDEEEEDKKLLYIQRLGKVGSWQIDLETEEFHVSSELYHILEALPKHLKTRKELYDLIVPQDKQYLEENNIHLFSGEKHPPLELKLKTFRNTNRTVQFIGNFRQDGLIVGLVRDITVNKRLENKVHKQKGRLNSIQKLAHIGSFEYNFLTKKAIWSDYMYELLGIEPFKPKFKSSIMSLIHADDQERVIRNLNEKSSEGKTYKEDFRMIKGDKSIIYVSATIHSKFDKNNRPIRSIGVIQDISDRKIAEQKITEQNKKLQVLNRQLDQFVYSVSHDLRAPLTSVKGLLELLELEENEAQRKEYQQLLGTSLHRLDDFIQDIVSLSRNSRQAVESIDVNFEEVFKEVIDTHRFSEDAENVKVHIDVMQTTPFLTDKKRLLIIVNNLYSNALRYHNPYIESPTVCLKAEVHKEYAIIKIKDNGQGIDKKHQEHIFEMFYRANSHKSGSGLGLYIVKETLEKINGKIELDSVYGKGATFTIRIPSLEKSEIKN